MDIEMMKLSRATQEAVDRQLFIENSFKAIIAKLESLEKEIKDLKKSKSRE